MEMFNDLRGTPEIRDHYQFWFYLYPTGQPFWITAAQLRQELAEARRALDPSFQSPALDHAVLVGHSMGGLIARLQTLESQDDFWRLISDQPISQLEAPDDVETALRRVMFFGPSPSVRRVVTIASPHRGSNFSNSATQWLGRRIIQLPESFLRVTEQLAHLDRKPLPEAEWLHHQTSIDALSPNSPFLSAMLTANTAPWIRYHNVVGRIAEERFWSKVAGQGDGVVQLDSARLEQASSELVVDADHLNIHRHPRTVLEVQRILLEHWDEVSRTAMQPRPAASLSRLPKP
jgi:pimeloyl-ACP methyl ester carboxylesterase